MKKKTTQTPQTGRKLEGQSCPPSPSREPAIRGGEVPLGQLLEGIAALPQLLVLAQEQQQQLESVLRELIELRSKVHNPDGWMDARGARAYLGGMSDCTFDKYHRLANPKIKGYKTDGKVLFHRDDLDLWVRLYHAKKSGEA